MFVQKLPRSHQQGVLKIRSLETLLLQREGELTRAANFLQETLEGSGGSLAIEGAPGIGKTSLMRAIRQLAGDLGMNVLAARGAELERDFPYGVVRQLFEPALRGSGPASRAQLLAGAAQGARPALEEVPRTDAPTSSVEGPFPILHGLYWLTANLAESSPLLIAIDDVQWADPSSLAFVAFLEGRLEELPIAVVMSTRVSDPEQDGPPRQSPVTGTVILRPKPLSVEATITLIRAALPDAGDEFCRACHTATGGNPFLLRQLITDLELEGIQTDATERERVEGLAPEAISRVVFVRLSQLMPNATLVARALAVLGDNAELRHAAVVAGLGEEEAAGAIDALVAADVVLAGPSFSFVHPIIREVIYQEVLPAEKALAHARAARALYESDVSPDRVVPHLMSCEPNAETWRISILRQSAREALARGAPEVAVSHLSRAVAETPDVALLPVVLRELGSAQARAGDSGGVATLRRALELEKDGATRAEIALELAQTLAAAGNLDDAFEVLDETVSSLGSAVDPELALRIEVELIGVARLHPETREQAHTRLERLRARGTSETVGGALLLANLALDAVESARPVGEVQDLAERALSHGHLLSEEGFTFSYAVNALTWTDQYAMARRAWDASLVEAQRRGWPLRFAFASTWRGHLGYREGLVDEAAADAQAGLEVLAEAGLALGIAYAGAFLADALIEKGDLASATALLADEDLGRHSPFFLDTRGRVLLLERRTEEALQQFLACGEMLAGRGGRDSPGIIPWRSGAALAYADLDQKADARHLVDEELALARRQEAPRAVGVALRAKGLVEDGDSGIESLRDSAEVLERSPARLEAARALVDLGAALRRAGQRAEAREPLRRGMDLANRCGAVVIESRAREELEASGARPRRAVLTGLDALTASERRVARMASEGMANREIAQALFVSMSTVASHLVRTYEKLAIDGRHELATVFAGEGPVQG